jgi:hypothetical protein
LFAVHAVSHEILPSARAAWTLVRRKAALHSKLFASFFLSFPCFEHAGVLAHTQARFSGPRGSALQSSANAVDENAADKAINAKPILSVVITGLVSISAGPNGYPSARY